MATILNDTPLIWLIWMAEASYVFRLTLKDILHEGNTVDFRIAADFLQLKQTWKTGNLSC